jgi:hypothetical protein
MPPYWPMARMRFDWKTLICFAVVMGIAALLILNMDAPPFPKSHRRHHHPPAAAVVHDRGPAVGQAVKVSTP